MSIIGHHAIDDTTLHYTKLQYNTIQSLAQSFCGKPQSFFMYDTHTIYITLAVAHDSQKYFTKQHTDNVDSNIDK